GQASGTLFPVGVTTVTYEYDDGPGNGPAVCSFTVTVADTEAPTVTSCPVDIAVANDPGVCGAVVTYAAPVFEDNCDGPGLSGTMTSGQASGTLFLVGVTTVTYEYDDGPGNGPAVCSFTVTVTDTEAPTVTSCPVDIAVANDPGVCGAVVTYAAPVFADNCDGAGLSGTMTAGQVSGTLFPVGITTVTYEYDDGPGNGPAVCSFTVTVSDTEAPTITSCPTDIAAANDPGVCGAVVTYAAPVFEDNCDGMGLSGIMTSGQASGTLFPVGLTTVTYEYSDASGNGPGVCSFTVTVTDTEAPTVTSCPVDIAVVNDPGVCGAVVTYAAPVFEDNCDGAGLSGTMTSGQASGTLFPVGVTTVTYEYDDGPGNGPAVCSFTVTVTDTEAPTFTVPADIILDCDEDVNDLGLTGDVTDEADNCDVGLDATYGDAVDGTDPCNVIITRSWILVDAASNTSIQPQLITVRDLTAPTALCQDITAQLDGTGQVSIAAGNIDNGSSDNCLLDTMWLDVYDFDCTNIGPNTVVLTVEDACGNQATCSATVTVEDNIVPAVACPGDLTETAVAGNCSMPVNGIGPSSVTGNCTSQLTYRLEGATLGSGTSDASGSVFNKGVTTVWYVIKDSNGNSDSCSFDVTVLTTVIAPTDAVSDPGEVCAGDGTIQLSYNGGIMPEGGSARWYDDAGLTSLIGEGDVISIPAPVFTTTYYVRLEGDCDTTAAVSTTVSVKALTVDPVSASVDRNNICAGDGTITLTYAGGDPGSNGIAVWYDDDLFTSMVGTGNGLSLTAPAVSTTYYVRFEADCDTSAAVAVLLNVWPLPVPVFTEMTENACTNGPLIRYVAEGLAGSTFTWSISNGTIVNDYNDTIYVDWGDQVVTGTLELTEISVNGCVSAPLNLQVEVGGPELDLGEDVGICMGNSISIDPDEDYDSYLWQDGSTGPVYTTDQEGWVILEVWDAYGCSAKDSLYITVNEVPVVDLGPDTSVCVDEGLVLDAGTDGDIYRWSTGDISQRITIYEDGDQEIWVEVENAFGCVGRDTVLIEACDIYYDFDPPTAITPNGDGTNDVWNLYGLLEFPQAEVEIYDQWGTLVWRSEPGYSQPWDGTTMNGRPVPVDSYHYVVYFNDGSDEKHIGIVTVIK
ncbi:MAG: HYR domain-containing protein, partial [Bacteroidota bacterium]|nr:HYR domain-containing protein [Bacteroidota bacterium]